MQADLLRVNMEAEDLVPLLKSAQCLKVGSKQVQAMQALIANCESIISEGHRLITATEVAEAEVAAAAAEAERAAAEAAENERAAAAAAEAAAAATASAVWGAMRDFVPRSANNPLNKRAAPAGPLPRHAMALHT